MARLLSVHVLPSEPGESAGLKGARFVQEFGACTLLIGPNGAGKTTRGPLSVTAAIEGLASVPTDTRRPYIGGAPLNTMVRLVLDTGAVVERDLSAQRGRAVESADTAARIHVGIPPTSWDLSDFASGTSGDRGRILDAVARAGGTLDGWDAQRCVDWIVAKIDGPVDDLAADLPLVPDGAAWLRAALGWAEKLQTNTNAAQRDAEGAARAAAARVTDDGEDVAALDRQVDDLVTLLATDGARERHLAEGARLRTALQSARALVERYETPEPMPAEPMRLDPIAPPDGPAPDRTAAQEHERGAAAALADIETLYRAASTGLRDAERLRAAAEARVVHADDTVCIHCGATDPLGRSLVSARYVEEAAQHAAAATAYSAEVAALTERGKAARETHRLAQQALATVDADRRTYDARVREADSRRIAIEQSARNHEAAVAAWSAREVRRAEGLEQARADVLSAQATLADWQSRDIPAGAPEGTRDALAALRSRRDAARATGAARAAAEAAWTRYEAARDAWTRARAIVQAVRETRDEMASAAYRPVHDAAQALLAGADGLPLPFFRGPDDFGAIIRGRRVAYAGLSESEQRITAAALVYALATVARCPVRLVLLDGLEVVQRDHRGPLLAALSRAVQAGLADTVIATMATAPGEDVSDLIQIDGLTVCEVSR